MEKNRVCKICNRRFANGKAMGGHMRSHLAKLPIPAKPTKSPSSSSSLTNPLTKIFMQPHPRSVNNRELITCTLPKADLDRESETESPRSLTKKRSKRCRRAVDQVGESPPEPDSVSSSVVTESFSDEDAAIVLLMLSKDKWIREKKKQRVMIVKREVLEEENESVDEEKDEEDKAEDHDSLNYKPRARLNKTYGVGKYRCDTCKKEFRSYQALGGHRASHKNKKIRMEPEEEDEDEEEEEEEEAARPSIAVQRRRIFECPFCEKVFESGQALGGHKKVHFSYLVPANNMNPCKSSTDKLLDLNLPAPEDEGEVVHQGGDHSTVYNNAAIYRPRT